MIDERKSSHEKKKSKHHRHSEYDVDFCKDAAIMEPDHDHDNDDDDSEQRRLRKRLRRAKKLAKHLEKLGLDENGDEIESYSLSKYPIREFKFTIPGMTDTVALNPVVSFIGIAFISSIVLWCIVDSVHALEKLGAWRSHLSLTFTWLLHCTKALFVFFLMFILCRYGHIRLGRKNDTPEYSLFTYTSMIFAVGVSNTLLVYSVSEPLSHTQYNFFAQAGYRSQDEIDMFAINWTVVDWGLGSWASYAVVAVVISLAAHRFRLPMTFRSCLYPILGAYTWGWIGDVVDGMAIAVTIIGIFTNLGLAAMNTASGFVHMGWMDDDVEEARFSAIQNTVVWVITILSLVSAISGLKGIKILCILAMGMAIFLLFFVVVLDDTKFLLNVQVQEVGYYLQTGIFELNVWTDAFGQLREGSGRAIDGRAADQGWMEAWFNFSQGFWLVAGVANGQFIAYVSRGRKLWELILCTIFVPVFYCLIWFCSWGGVGLRQSRQALELHVLGETYYNSTSHFLADGGEFCYDVPQEDLIVDGNVVFTNYLPGVTPVCLFDEENPNTSTYNVMNSFRFASTFAHSVIGPAMSFLFMLACVVFYMAGAGAAALVVDKMASSGRKNNHLARRMFWILTVGVLTTALLSSSAGADSLPVLQAAMIVCGVPLALLLCYLLQCIVLFCQAAERLKDKADYEFPNQPEFLMPVYGGIFNVFEYVASLGRVNAARVEQGMDQATQFQVVEFVKGVAIPFIPLQQILTTAFPQNPRKNTAFVVCYGLCYVAWICLVLSSIKFSGLNGIKWGLFIVKGVMLAVLRSSFRKLYNLRSNAIGDLFASLFIWPQVLTQMQLQCCTANAEQECHVEKTHEPAEYSA